MSNFDKKIDKLKTKIDNLIDEGHKLDEAKDLTEHERRLIVKNIIDNDIKKAMDFVIDEIKEESIFKDNEEEVRKEFEQLRLSIEEYIENRFKNL